MKKAGLSFELDGALWFRTTDFGDDKDRVLRKSDGSLTYFASDIAYHDDKYRRGFDRVVDVWGADHHGDVPRMIAAVQAVGRKAEDLDVVLIQLVNLLENGTQVAMSTRAGRPLTDKWTFSTNGVSIQGRYGIPCVGFGPGAESQAHAPNEITWKQDLVTCAALYAAVPGLYKPGDKNESATSFRQELTGNDIK